MSKRLFSLNSKRKSQLSNICALIRDRINELQSETRFQVRLSKNQSVGTNDEIIRLENEIINYKLAYDVVKTIAFHSESYLLKSFVNEYKGWQNEFDIPLEIFKSSINFVIDLMNICVEDKNYGHELAPNLQSYTDYIELLKQIVEYRDCQEKKIEFFDLTAEKNRRLDKIANSLILKIKSEEINLSHNHYEKDNDKKDEVIDYINSLKLAYDIIDMIIDHSSSHTIELIAYEQRDWDTEIDVPLDVFVKAMEAVLRLMNFYIESSFCENQNKYISNIELINELLEFRKSVEFRK